MSHSLASAQNEKCRLNTHLNTFSQHFCSNLIKINRPFHLCVWLVINMCCFEFGFDVDRKCSLRLFLLEFWFFFPFLRRIEYSRVQLVNTHGYVFVRWLWVFCSQNLLTFFLANSFGKYESIANGSGGIPANTWLHTLENASICSRGLFHYGSLINWFKKNTFACLMRSSSSLFVCVSFFIETSNWFYCFSSFFPIQFESVSFDLNGYFCHWGGTFFSVSTLRLNDKNLLNWIFLLRLNNTAYNYYCEWSLCMNIALHSFVHVITGTKSSSVSMETETQSWF